MQGAGTKSGGERMSVCIFIISLEFPLQIKRDQAISTEILGPRGLRWQLHILFHCDRRFLSNWINYIFINSSSLEWSTSTWGQLNRGEREALSQTQLLKLTKILTPNLQRQGRDAENRRHLTTNCSDVHRNSLSHLVYKDSKRQSTLKQLFPK